MVTVFLSSTCYDLPDLRSVLFHSLKANGFDTIASDIPSSDFSLAPNLNSVEICEANVGRSNLVLLILDKRYGPQIPSLDKSATHIECEAALRRGIPVHTFVRKSFLHDHRVWQRMTKAGVTAAGVASALTHVDCTIRNGTYEFESLFRLFDSVRRTTEPGKPNWCDPFETAHDLSWLAPRRARELLHADIGPLHIAEKYTGLVAEPALVDCTR